MKIEVIKLREIVKGGKTYTIIDIDDFKRLISEYQVTLPIFKETLGLSRKLWDNTMMHYNLTKKDTDDFRNLIIVHKELHLNSNHGFSKIINKEDLSSSVKEKDIKRFVKYLSIFNKDLPDLWYSKLKDNPVSLSEDLYQVSKDLLEVKWALKKLIHRVRKECNKKGLEHKRLISSTLEHTVSKILDDLGLKYESQLYLKPYHYDFLIYPKTILEIDGGLHNNRFDKEKELVAKALGYNIIRLEVDKKGIKKYNYDDYKNKISKKLRSANRL